MPNLKKDIYTYYNSNTNEMYHRLGSDTKGLPKDSTLVMVRDSSWNVKKDLRRGVTIDKVGVAKISK